MRKLLIMLSYIQQILIIIKPQNSINVFQNSGPGLFCFIPCTDTFFLVDKRTVSFDVPPQEILTKDNVTVTVNGVVYYRIIDSNGMGFINLKTANYISFAKLSTVPTYLKRILRF